MTDVFKSNSFAKRLDQTNYLLLGLSVLILFILGQFYGTRYQFAWRDETLFYDIAKNFANNGILGAPSYAGNGMKMEFRTYFMPPVYPLILGLWFKMMPQTLESARLLSQIFGSVFLLFLFGFGHLYRKKTIIPGLICLILVINPLFGSLYNWARPDMLALLFSFASLYYYQKFNLNRNEACYKYLFIAWALATLGMLTHPVAGFIGFGAIPIHLLLTNFNIVKKPFIFLSLIVIPLVLVSFWGIYILNDLEAFKMQFIDWQMSRKSSRMLDNITLLRNMASNIGYNHQNKVNLLISALILLAFFFRLVFEKTIGKTGLLVLIILTITGFVVENGDEMPYPPLRMPAYYILLLFCTEPFQKVFQNLKIINFRNGRLNVNYSLVFIPIMIFIPIQLSVKTFNIVKEINYSERRVAYNYETLASELIASTPYGKSIGIRITPDCFDILESSKHFTKVNQLSWFDLNDEDFEKLIEKNDYLAITQSVLNPGEQNILIDFTGPEWSNQLYNSVINKHFVLDKIIQLPNGGKTALYKKTDYQSVQK